MAQLTGVYTDGNNVTRDVPLAVDAQGRVRTTGGGGGATEFTQLTDCPETISANQLVAGNGDGDALIFVPYLILSENTLRVDIPWDGETSAVGIFGVGVSGTGAEVGIETVASIEVGGIANAVTSIVASTDGGGTAELDITASSDTETPNSGIAELNLVDGAFKMTGFDVVASSITAEMTVDGHSYAIGKAVQVLIGSDTYFWPLFGPVVPD